VRTVARAVLIVAVCLLGLRSARADSCASSRLKALADQYQNAATARMKRPDRLGIRSNRAWVIRIRQFERRLARIDNARLDRQGRITHAMLATELAHERQYVTQGWAERDVSGTDSPAQTIADLADPSQLNSAKQWRRAIRTMAGSGRFMDRYIELLETGLRRGRLQTRDAVESAIASISILSSQNRRQNPFLGLRAALDRSLIGKPELPALRRLLDQVISEQVLPAHRRLRRFLLTRYLPRAATLGRDRDAYLHFMELHLGPNHPSPEELHRLGCAEIERLTGELLRTVRAIDRGAAGLGSFMRGLRQRASSGYKNADALIAATYAEIDRARELARVQLPIPRSQVSVHPVPLHQEATVAAQYSSTGESRGAIEVNTGPLLSSQRRFQLPALVTHELFGGHHLAAIYAQRQVGRLPLYRTQAASTAFDEGWALYCEELRDRQGGYRAEERIGYLVGQLWRAARLVVDTGLHTGVMTPAQARRYFQKATFVSSQAAAAEIQREIDWPAQALAYYVGKREILDIRAQVEKLLGKGFSARKFHARMLSLGSVPLSALRAEMISWARRRAGQLGRLSLSY
jgi:uncharacterized protein (DUF885 family)